MTGQFYIANSEETLQNVYGAIQRLWDLHHWIEVQIKHGKLRTTRQNRALHLWFRMVAKALNEAGITWEQFFTRFDFEFSEHIVKENIWRPVQIGATGKESTTELERQEVSFIYDQINERMPVHVPFPEKVAE